MSKKIVFTSDDLPPGLDEGRRRSLWHDLYVQAVGPCDISYLPDRPMSVRFEFAPAGTAAVGKYQGTMGAVGRNASQAAVNPSSAFYLSFNTGSSEFCYDLGFKEGIMSNGSLMLLYHDTPSTLRANDVNSWQGVQFPMQQLLERVPGAEDLICKPLPDTPAGRMYRRYVNFLCNEDGFSNDPALSGYVEMTLLDLATLVLGSSRDAMEISRLRGLRAARLQTVLAKIKSDFARPEFSTETVARSLGLSRRYVNELLHESGETLAERVLELRLQKARTMLADPRHGHLKVSEIALACGFNEVSYFNRRFRARFGCSPTQYRGAV